LSKSRVQAVMYSQVLFVHTARVHTRIHSFLPNTVLYRYLHFPCHTRFLSNTRKFTTSSHSLKTATLATLTTNRLTVSTSPRRFPQTLRYQHLIQRPQTAQPLHRVTHKYGHKLARHFMGSVLSNMDSKQAPFDKVAPLPNGMETASFGAS
jgi:hypothetical protein